MVKIKLGTSSRAIKDISDMLNRYSNTKKERLLSFWLSEYSRYIKQEETFDPRYLKRYKRGEIIKINLGYRLGSEQGGLHYAVVLDKKNSIHSDIVTVLPLSSKKPTTKLNRYTLDLGNEIYNLLINKANNALSNIVKTMSKASAVSDSNVKASVTFQLDFSEHQKIIDEIKMMKEGSIALISQITTISKMRIIKPQKNSDALSGICLSSESLDKIDEKILELYIGKIK